MYQTWGAGSTSESYLEADAEERMWPSTGVTACVQLAIVVVLSLGRCQNHLEDCFNYSLLGPPCLPPVVWFIWCGAGLENWHLLSFQVMLLLPLVWGPRVENDWAAGELTHERLGAVAVVESRAFMWLKLTLLESARNAFHKYWIWYLKDFSSWSPGVFVKYTWRRISYESNSYKHIVDSQTIPDWLRYVKVLL